MQLRLCLMVVAQQDVLDCLSDSGSETDSEYRALAAAPGVEDKQKTPERTRYAHTARELQAFAEIQELLKPTRTIIWRKGRAFFNRQSPYLGDSPRPPTWGLTTIVPS